jgi:hypothetical protein
MMELSKEEMEQLISLMMRFTLYHKGKPSVPIMFDPSEYRNMDDPLEQRAKVDAARRALKDLEEKKISDEDILFNPYVGMDDFTNPKKEDSVNEQSTSDRILQKERTRESTGDEVVGRTEREHI